MRVAPFAWLLLGTLQLSAQQTAITNSTVSSVLQGMKGSKWTQRAEAFGQAADLLSSPETTPKDADRLRVGIIQLLVAENSDKTPVTEENEGDEQGEYYAGLVGFVGHMGDERAIPALLGASGTGGMATRAVARFGKKALDPTLAQAGGQDPRLAEGALFVVRDMLEFGLVDDPDSHLRIRNALRTALASPEELVRETAISAIEYMKDREEFVPELRAVAQHDPYKLDGHSDDGQDNGEIYPVRRAARILLKQIASHEKPPVDQGLPASEYQPVSPDRDG